MTHAKALRINALKTALAASQRQFKLAETQIKRAHKRDTLNRGDLMWKIELRGAIHYLTELLHREESRPS